MMGLRLDVYLFYKGLLVVELEFWFNRDPNDESTKFMSSKVKQFNINRPKQNFERNELNFN